MVNEHVPSIHECKWGYAKTTLFFDITTVYYVSCMLLPFICSWYSLFGLLLAEEPGDNAIATS